MNPVTLPAQQAYFGHWPEGCSPAAVGARVAQRFVETPHTNFGSAQPPSSVTYPEVCAWYGALKFAEASNDKTLSAQLESRFTPLLDSLKRLVPAPDHVDHTVFGAIPLELYRQTGNGVYKDMGLSFADRQWEMPVQQRPEYKGYLDKGLSWQTRFWIDDMFMITLIQSQAYRASGQRGYIDRAAHEMAQYLDTIQRPNGLFYHAPDVPFFWGRGNGWMAAGMTELLRSLPKDNPNYKKILKAYRQMMSTLAKHQSPNGLWRQLVDDSTAWPESSCTGMFAYAMITGVKKGWLDKKQYGPVAEKAWLGLVSYINENADVRDVCEGTNKKNSRAYYLERKRIAGDLHGQAPVLWCAYALLEGAEHKTTASRSLSSQTGISRWSLAADSAQQALTREFWSVEHGYYTHSNNKTGFDYWWNAHALDVLVDGYNRTKQPVYVQQMKAVCEGIYKKNKEEWPNEYYDDMEWLALACLRALDATGDVYYKKIADLLWADIKKGWANTMGGGMLWKKTPPPSRNACSNGPAIILAARLYRLDKHAEDLAMAQRVYNWERATLVDTVSGAVWDNIKIRDGIPVINKRAVLTYNIGTWLGGALELFRITGKREYLADAVKSARLVVNDPNKFSPGGILKGENRGDAGLFKGIFIRYFTELLFEKELDKGVRAEYTAYMKNNGESLLDKATLPGVFLFGADWRSLPAATDMDCSVQLSGIMLLEALDRLSVAKLL
jgi:predicted alpha-1,6-mannanase (GH76 family)